MPSFYEQDASGKASGGPEDILDGDNEQQIQALRDYLMVLSNADQVLARNQKRNGAVAAAAQMAMPHRKQTDPTRSAMYRAAADREEEECNA